MGSRLTEWPRSPGGWTWRCASAQPRRTPCAAPCAAAAARCRTDRRPEGAEGRPPAGQSNHRPTLPKVANLLHRAGLTEIAPDPLSSFWVSSGRDARIAARRALRFVGRPTHRPALAGRPGRHERALRLDHDTRLRVTGLANRVDQTSVQGTIASTVSALDSSQW